jgi:hypothetical protein
LRKIPLSPPLERGTKGDLEIISKGCALHDPSFDKLWANGAWGPVPFVVSPDSVPMNRDASGPVEPRFEIDS